MWILQSRYLCTERTTTAAWRSKPSWYQVSTQDRTINPDLERFLAKRMKAHMLVPDGVYLTETDPPYFRNVPAPTAAELQTLVQTISERIGQRLERTGKLVRDEESSYLTLDSQGEGEDAVLKDLQGHSIQYRIAVGRIKAATVRAKVVASRPQREEHGYVARVLGVVLDPIGIAIEVAHVAIHGAPHPYNVLLADGEPRFIDFETACTGPVEWDLAHLDSEGEPFYGSPLKSRLLWVCRGMASVKAAVFCWADFHRGDLRDHQNGILTMSERVLLRTRFTRTSADELSKLSSGWPVFGRVPTNYRQTSVRISANYRRIAPFSDRARSIMQFATQMDCYLFFRSVKNGAQRMCGPKRTW